MDIDQRYEWLLGLGTDMKDHLPRLRELASSVRSVTEFGLRAGASTTALLAGRPASYCGYDIDIRCDCRYVVTLADPETTVNLGLGPRLGNSLLVDIEPTDLLMIDSYHSMDHVYNELMTHSAKVLKFIVLHDTRGWYARNDEDGKPGGVLGGIEKWLSTTVGKCWELIEDRETCHGLQVYKRIMS